MPGSEITVRDDLVNVFSDCHTVDDFLSIEGEVYREVKGQRRTSRFEREGRTFFIKAHYGVGWREILKNLVSLRLPVLGADNEWRAIKHLHELTVPTMTLAAWGRTGWNPARIKSFVITDALQDVAQLDHWWPEARTSLSSREAVRLKRALIEQVAWIARTLHHNGLNHRDMYLCHFLVQLKDGGIPKPEDIRLYLIDLHRVQQRGSTPERWVIKDVAGLFFSSMDMGLTARDYLRFVHSYSGESLRSALSTGFWTRVFHRAVRLYRRDHHRQPVLPSLINLEAAGTEQNP